MMEMQPVTTVNICNEDGARCTHEAVGASILTWSGRLRCISSTASAVSLLCRKFGSFVFCKSLLEVGCCFELWLFRNVASCSTRRRVASGGLTIGLCLVETSQDSLVVQLSDIFRDTLHAKDFDIEASSVRKSVVDCCEIFFMDLTHVNAQTWIWSACRHFLRIR